VGDTRARRVTRHRHLARPTRPRIAAFARASARSASCVGRAIMTFSLAYLRSALLLLLVAAIFLLMRT
jgi:hypothetical protein